MRVKVIEQGDFSSQEFENIVNKFLSDEIIVIHIRVNKSKDSKLFATIIYKKGNM